MGRCESSFMHIPIVIRHRFRVSRSHVDHGLWLIGLVALFLLGWQMMSSPAAMRTASTVDIQPLVHFRDASHDWLLVVDATTDEVVVYDAATGRPLQRLGADDGLASVKSIDREGSRLLVTSRQQPAIRVLTLPDFQPVALNDR